MNAGGKRQLPSWMNRTTVNEQASNSGTKGENKENDAVKFGTKIVEPLKKKVQVKKHENRVPVTEKESQMLKKCEVRTKKRKPNKYEEGQAERFQENESCLLKPCKVSSDKRMASKPKHVEDRVDDLFEIDREKKENVAKKRTRNNAPRKKPSETLLGKSHAVIVEFDPSEDELTVEDLVSIAEEYVKADGTDFQKPKVEEDTISLHRADTQIGLGKNLTTHRENNLVSGQPVSSDSSSAKPLSGEGHIVDLSTFDPTRDMLDLFLGPRWRKNSEEEKKTDSVTEKFTFDYELSKYELSKKIHNDSTTEVARVMKKKTCLKDKIQGLLD